MKSIILITLICVLVISDVYASGAKRPCQGTHSKYVFCNTNLSDEERVKNLVSLLTLEEKYTLMGHTASGVDRLGIPAYEWWSEALHGVADSPGVHFRAPTPFASSFPQPILSAASFSRDLWRRIGDVVGIEARSFANEGNAGYTFWTPNINIVRDPRWGRGQETPGEDPYLTTEYALSFVQAVQRHNGTHAPRLLASACVKHFFAYSLEDWHGVDRFHFNAVVDERDLNDTYLVAFEASLPYASSIMCSYNAVNGIPSCANVKYLRDIVRGKWGFDGYVTSDCGAIETIYSSHHYTATPEATCKVALESGVDQDCGDFYTNHLPNAIKQGIVKESQIDFALANQYRVMMRLGWFDGDQLPMNDPKVYGAKNVSTDAHELLTLEAAIKSIVLLKNERRALPLSPIYKKIAVVGPHGNATEAMLGNYYGKPRAFVSPLKGMKGHVYKDVEVDYAQGCDVNSTRTDGFDAACKLVSEANAVLAVMGINEKIASEGHDRDVLELPGVQEAFVDKMLECAPPHAPFVLVIMAGSVVALDKYEHDHRVSAIVWLGYPGQWGGAALAKLVLADGGANPSGRLPITWYKSDYVNQISMFNMNMRPGGGSPGRTYRFFDGQPVYAFGHGLSYTTFSFKWHHETAQRVIHLDARHIQSIVSQHPYSRAEPRQFVVDKRVCVVKNTGARTGDVSVLAMLEPPQHNGAPRRFLFGFARVNDLKSQESRTVDFNVPPHLFVDAANRVVRGLYRAVLMPTDAAQYAKESKRSFIEFIVE